MGVNADRQPVIHPQLGHGADAVAEGFPFGRIHLLGFRSAASGRGTAGRDGIDQHQVLGPMRHQRLAGARGTIPHVIPFGGIVKRAKDHAADQR